MKQRSELAPEQALLFPNLVAGRWHEREAKTYLELVLAASLQATTMGNFMLLDWLVSLEDRPSKSSLTLLLERVLLQEVITPRDLDTVYEVGQRTPGLEMQLWMRGLPGLLVPDTRWQAVETAKAVEEKN
jgi:hypothetical protein